MKKSLSSNRSSRRPTSSRPSASASTELRPKKRHSVRSAKGPRSAPPIPERRPDCEELEYFAAAVDPEKQWYMPAGVGGGAIGVIDAWREMKSVGNRDVVIGFIDDGFDLGHPDLKHTQVNKHYRFDFDDGLREVTHPRDLVNPSAFHGTPCFGLAMGRPQDGGGIVGIAPGCSAILTSYPVTEGDVVFDLRAMLAELHSQIDVLCLPFHPDPFESAEGDLFGLSGMLESLHESGGPEGRGVVICASAGNDAIPIRQLVPGQIEFTEFLSGRHRKGATVDNPLAASPHTLTVAASTSSGRHAQYSNWGSEVNAAAPSNNFAPGSSRRHIRWVEGERKITVPWSRFVKGEKRNGAGSKLPALYRNDFGGTSAATAIMAGAAALVRSANRKLTAKQVMEILEKSADKILERKSRTEDKAPFGEYGPNGRSYWFGHGRVNVLSAVKMARERRRPSIAAAARSAERTAAATP